MKKWTSSLWKDTRGDAIVEAAILFPIILMIFAALIMLAIYLPTRANLQRATQYAATAIATEKSDTWLSYDTDNRKYYWKSDRDELDNVYYALIRSIGGSGGDEENTAVSIVQAMEDDILGTPPGELTVDYGITNYIVYKEITVTATRTIKPVLNLSFIGFPTEIPIAVSSTAVVLNGDEFVRNVDIAVDVSSYLAEKLHLTDAISKVRDVCGKFNNCLGI